MSYEIIDFYKRDLPEIVFSKQVIEKLKLDDLSSEVRSGFSSQYFKEKEYWVCSDGEFAYLQNRSEKWRFQYYKSKDWTKTISENLFLKNYLARLKNTRVIDSKIAIYPDWSNFYVPDMKKVAIPVKDACGLFLFLSEDDKIEINLYEKNMKDKNKLAKIITLADFKLIAKS